MTIGFSGTGVFNRIWFATMFWVNWFFKVVTVGFSIFPRNFVYGAFGLCWILTYGRSIGVRYRFEFAWVGSSIVVTMGQVGGPQGCVLTEVILRFTGALIPIGLALSVFAYYGVAFGVVMGGFILGLRVWGLGAIGVAYINDLSTTFKRGHHFVWGHCPIFAKGGNNIGFFWV